jgi:hypothetical protein
VASEGTTVSVSLLVFSGRPDPEWTLDEQTAGQLAERVKKTLSGEQVRTEPIGGLGYRGFTVRTQRSLLGLPTEFTVYQDVLTVEPGPKAVHWRDTGGVEDWLLSQARERGFGDFLDWGGARTRPIAET